MNRKVSVVFNRYCFPKMKDFSRLPPLQAVMYIVKVVVVLLSGGHRAFIERRLPVCADV